jgi:hypothetical protein
MMQQIRFSQKQFKAVVAFKTGGLIKNELYYVQQIMIVEACMTKFRNIVAWVGSILDGLIVMPLYRCLVS